MHYEIVCEAPIYTGNNTDIIAVWVHDKGGWAMGKIKDNGDSFEVVDGLYYHSAVKAVQVAEIYYTNSFT